MKYFISSLLFLMHFTVSVLASERPLIIAVEGTYPPFSYVEPDGRLNGFDVEIGQEICREMQRECKIVTQNWEGLIPGLMEHKFDMLIASQSITDARSKVVAFSHPYYYEYGSFIASKDKLKIPLTSKNLKGKRIGVQIGTIFALYAAQKWKNIAEIIYYNSQENANLDLLAGRLDYLIANITSIHYSLLSRKKGRAYTLVGPRIDDPKIVGKGAGIVMRREDDQLIRLVNKALDHLKTTPRYFSFLKQFHIAQ